MWSRLESGYRELSKQDKGRVEEEAAPLGKDVTFRGCDGNYESEHMGIARVLIDGLDRFSTFKGRDHNSHVPSIAASRMLRVFEPMRPDLMGAELSASQIIDILRAMIDPRSQKV